MPPFDGPRATLCVTRYPWKTCVDPSSIATGTETDTAFLHSWRTFTRFGSIAKAFATRCSCSRAISNGFSRRCETGASTIVTSTPFSAQMGHFRLGARTLLDRERLSLDRRRSGIRAVCEQPQLVVAAREHRACRVTTSDTERVTPRQHVAEACEQSDAATLPAPQLEVEPEQRQDGGTAGHARHGAGDEAQQRRRGVRRAERMRREVYRGERRGGTRAEEDRPRHMDLVSRDRCDDEVSVGGRLALRLAGNTHADVHADRSPRRE